MADTDLLHHFKVLKQFLDISDDANSRAKLNSSRAARAREKLLRLSQAQFRELSTDVYDELRRRIDESRSEPDFLLPKLTFHPKRNQARQKLSSLPQSRFKDLVSDISFEIERRNLHNPIASSVSVNPPANSREVQESHPQRAHGHSRSQSTDHHHVREVAEEPKRASVASRDHAVPFTKVNQDQPRHSTLSHSTGDTSHGPSNQANTTALRDELATPDLRNPVTEQPIGIQPTTVVPTKASMTWSSDEEDAAEELKELRRSVQEEPRQLALSDAFTAPRPIVNLSVAENSEEPAAFDRGTDNDQEHDSLKTAYENLRKEHESLIEAHSDAQIQLGELKNLQTYSRSQGEELEATCKAAQQDLKDLSEKHEEVLTRHEDLEALYQQLKHENDEFVSQRAALPSPEELNALHEELKELRASNAALRLENQNLKSTSPKSRGLESLSREIKPHTMPAFPSEKSSIKVNDELQILHDRLEQNEAPRSSPSEKEAMLKSEITQWQKKYEALKAGELNDMTKNPIKTMDLTKFRSPDGLLSYSTAVELFASIDLFYVALEIPSPDADLFFERISSIAVTANAIANQGTKSGFSDNVHSDAIRECASHALTATRYYLIYPTLMPKVIVEKAVSEIAFAVCDSIAAMKFAYNSDEERTTHQNKVNNTLPYNAIADDIDVKPLKIPQKRSPVASSPNFEPSSNGASSSHKHETALSDVSVGSNQFSPIQLLGGQSLPTPKRGYVQYSSDGPREESRKTRASDSSPFKSITSFKEETHVEQSAPLQLNEGMFTDATEANHLVETPHKGDKVERAGIESVSAPPQTKATEETDLKSHAKSNTPSILDKVRRFEKGNTGLHVTSPVSNEKGSFGKISASRSTLIGRADKDAVTHESPNSAPVPPEGVPARNKSIFQSLRERFTNDNTAPKLVVEVRENVAGGDGEDQNAKSDDEIKNQPDSTKTMQSLESTPHDKGSEHLNATREVQVNPTGGSQANAASPLESLDFGISEASSSTRSSNYATGTVFNRPTPESAKVVEAINSGDTTAQANDFSLTTRAETEASLPENARPPEKSDNISSLMEKFDESASDDLMISRDDRNGVPMDSQAHGASNHQPAAIGQSLKEANSEAGKLPAELSEVHGSGLDKEDSSVKAKEGKTVPASDEPTRLTMEYPQDSINNLVSAPNSDELDIPRVNVLDVTNSDRETHTVLTSKDISVSDGSNQTLSIQHHETGLSQIRRTPDFVDKENLNQAEDPTDEDEQKEPILNHSRAVSDITEGQVSAPKPAVVTKGDSAKIPSGLKIKTPSFKVRKVSYEDAMEEQNASDRFEDEDDESFDEEEDEIRQRQDYRKSMAAATFNFDLFDIDDPDNTVTQVLLYLEHQTVQVISTIQDLLSAIKRPDATKGVLRENSGAISEVIKQMTEATNTSMNQTRNYQLREHGSWVVKSLEDCNHRMTALCKQKKESDDLEFADRHFKQRLAGISFDIAKSTKELVKTVEEASLKEDIAHLDARLNHPDDLT